MIDKAKNGGASLERWRGGIEEKLSNVQSITQSLLQTKDETSKSLANLSLQVKELSTKISVYVPIIAFACSAGTSILIGIIVAFVTAKLH